jgi:SAM-dependent methyltransferase
MNQRDKDETIQRYAQRINELGPTVQALGWRNQQQQALRFSVLAEIGDLAGKSVLDVGCGFGDFYDFLLKAGIRTEYTGIDISREVLAEARKRHSGVRFAEVDLLGDAFDDRFDYVVESGIFNHRITDNEQFVQKMLKAMYERCEIGVAANMMTSYVDYRDDHLYYYDPETVLHYAKGLSRYATMRHDYPLYEFSVFIYRESRYSN